MFKNNKRGVMSLGLAIAVVICIDAFLFMGQMAVYDITREMDPTLENITFFNYQGSLISKYDKGGYTISTNSSFDDLIGTSGSVDPATGDIFTDTFSKVKEWFVSKIPGVAIFLSVLAGPYGYLVMFNVPAWFSYTVGALWMGITIFLIIAFIAGRQE
jgi:hypothetical protein